MGHGQAAGWRLERYEGELGDGFREGGMPLEGEAEGWMEGYGAREREE